MSILRDIETALAGFEKLIKHLGDKPSPASRFPAAQSMVYLLEEKPLDRGHLYFQLLNGYLRHVRNEDVVDDLDPQQYSGKRAMCAGVRVRTDSLPTRIRSTTNHNVFPDYAVAYEALLNYKEPLGHICSARFRDLVESLEPGIHQFEAVEVFSRNDAAVATMNWFVPCARVDAWTLPLEETRNVHTSIKNRKDAEFSRQLIGSHHLWVEKRDISQDLWVSSEFHDRAMTTRLTGFELIGRKAV